MTNLHFSSARDDYGTPPEIFAGLNAEFGFELDVCATAENTKCKKYFSPEQDGLQQKWAPRVCFCNPPYGRVIGRWLEKAYLESIQGALVSCLVPARTDTKWWHQYAKRGEIRYLRGRIKFIGAEHPAPFPSAVVIFRPPILGLEFVPKPDIRSL
ncbi:MAG: hypothetical protein KDA87_03850 [Planctomycetales bacterium]|nr:hypothetical protein [Planctomycetales bacterium]